MDETLLSALIVLVIQASGVILVAVAGAIISGLLLRRLGRLSSSPSIAERCNDIQHSLRSFAILLALLGCLSAFAWNGWLWYQGIDPLSYSLSLLQEVDQHTWLRLLQALGLCVLGILAGAVAVRFIRRSCNWAEGKVQLWGQVEANDAAISRFFRGLSRALVNSTWLGVLIFVGFTLSLPDAVLLVLFHLTTIYLIIAVGLTIIRITAVVVDSLNALSARYAESKSWFRYYDRLRPLVPLLRRCLEYALWIGVGSLVLAQLPPVSGLAQHGPSLIKAIGVFFLARVAIELAHLLIDQLMLGNQDIDEAERKRRMTIVPLIKTVGKQVIYFAAFVLILGLLGFDPMPFLAGAGILGVVIGLGAQPLINDVVSGFFILFENTFLVGDLIRCGDTYGRVEGIDFRTTRVRDPDGNLHVLRNGDLRHVINYSKDYSYAVLEVTVAHDSNLDQALEVLRSSAQAVAEDPRVTGEVEVRGVIRLDNDGARLRAIIPVQAGEHFQVSAAWRQAAVAQLQRAGISLVPQRRIGLERPSAESAGDEVVQSPGGDSGDGAHEPPPHTA